MSTPLDTTARTSGDVIAHPSATPRPRGRARLIIGYLAVAAVQPYLILKLTWIAGSTIGITETSPLDASVVRGGNIVTAVMELTAIAILLAFTHQWGLRVPAWLVLVPAWIGTGLLAPFVITGPVIAASVVSDLAPVGDDSLAPWVGPLVYLSFGAQAVGIASCFVLYAKERWPYVFSGHLSDRLIGPSRTALVPIAWGTAALLVVVSVARLPWSLGAAWGLPSSGESRGVAEQLTDGASALFAVAAAVGILMLAVGRPSRTRTWVPVALAWIGGGATLGAGAYSLVLLFTKLTGAVDSVPATGMVPFVDLLQVVAGVAIGVAGAVILAADHARSSTRADPVPLPVAGSVTPYGIDALPEEVDDLV